MENKLFFLYVEYFDNMTSFDDYFNNNNVLDINYNFYNDEIIEIIDENLNLDFIEIEKKDLQWIWKLIFVDRYIKFLEKNCTFKQESLGDKFFDCLIDKLKIYDDDRYEIHLFYNKDCKKIIDNDKNKIINQNNFAMICSEINYIIYGPILLWKYDKIKDIIVKINYDDIINLFNNYYLINIYVLEYEDNKNELSGLKKYTYHNETIINTTWQFKQFEFKIFNEFVIYKINDYKFKICKKKSFNKYEWDSAFKSTINDIIKYEDILTKYAFGLFESIKSFDDKQKNLIEEYIKNNYK